MEVPIPQLLCILISRGPGQEGRMMQGASAEGRNGDSPSEMDESSAKKARLLELPNDEVKQETAGEVIGAVEYSSRVELAVRIDMRVLHCPLCSLPFKPPVLHCNGGHLACGVCVAALPAGDGVFGPCQAMDAVVSSTRVACAHDGCGRFVVYHEAVEHRSACAHAPCHCTEPGCAGFAPASPAALAGHLASVHTVPVRNVRYGKVSRLQVPASVQRLLLVAAEDDGRVFLLTVGALGGAGAAAVSVVCVRASAASRPTFTCKMWADMPPPAANGHGKSDVVNAEMQMWSSTSPGAVVASHEPTFLAVPPMYMVPGPGDAPSMEVALSVRIDKVSPWSC